MFFNMDARARHKNADEMIAHAQAMLTDPVLASLEGTTDLLDITSRYYVPNFSHGTLVVPRQYKDDGDRLALVPLNDTEKILIPGKLFDPIKQQVENANKHLEKQGMRVSLIDYWVDTLVDSLRREGVEWTFPRENVPASVRTHEATYKMHNTIDGTSKVSVLGRPVTLYKRSWVTEDISEGIFPGLVLIHEAVHARQSLTFNDFFRDFHSIDESMARELEAYSRQSTVADRLYSSRSDTYRHNDFLQESSIHNVENMRIGTDFDPRQPFRYTPTIARLLSEAGIDI